MKRNSLILIFPHQLFRNHPLIRSNGQHKICLVEDALFFGDYINTCSFHKQKLWLHRASMKNYENDLLEQCLDVDYVDHILDQDPLRLYLSRASESGINNVLTTDPHDYLLSRRLKRYCELFKLNLEISTTPMFLNNKDENTSYRKNKKRWFMADYYKHQRKKWNVLMDGNKPLFDKWSFDDQNRKKVPQKMLNNIPSISSFKHSDSDRIAREYINKKYPQNPGKLSKLIYPTSHDGAKKWLSNFLKNRFQAFGPYEDAIVKNENWLWHSVLTPVMNIGLITPKEVIDSAVEYAAQEDVPINSLEGFIRQIIGWREFMRAAYEDIGSDMRNSNEWKHSKKIPQSFYDGTTGIEPIDNSIKRILKTGYCHHIERLMVLGGFMFLCEFDPKEIYKWFMEMFVDSYDWVMVPNVFGMSQNADGGLIATKPYFSGSSYVRKMSNYSKGEWESVWDGLYWRWINNHSDSLSKNPRWAMMCSMVKKMNKSKLDNHIQVAENYLLNINNN